MLFQAVVTSRAESAYSETLCGAASHCYGDGSGRPGAKPAVQCFDTANFMKIKIRFISTAFGKPLLFVRSIQFS